MLLPAIDAASLRDLCARAPSRKYGVVALSYGQLHGVAGHAGADGVGGGTGSA